MFVLVGAALLFGAVAPWWVWPMLILIEAGVFIVLGNHWADQDAAKASSDDHD